MEPVGSLGGGRAPVPTPLQHPHRKILATGLIGDRGVRTGSSTSCNA